MNVGHCTATINTVQHKVVWVLTARAPSVRSNSSFLLSDRSPKPIISNSPHFRSVRLRNLSSGDRAVPSNVPSSLSSRNDIVEDVEVEVDSDGALLSVEADELVPVSGWKLAGRSMRFLYASE